MHKNTLLSSLSKTITPRFGQDSDSFFRSFNAANIGSTFCNVRIKSLIFLNEPDEDIFQFYCLMPGDDSQQQIISITRKELGKHLFQHEINMLMLRSRVCNCCKLAIQHPCDECVHEGDCPGIKISMGLQRHPRDLHPVEDKEEIESEEFTRGLDVVCWQVDEAIAERLLIKDQG